MRFQEFICCPKCRGQLLGGAAESEAAPQEGKPVCYTCSACSREYPIVNDVADFLPHSDAKKGRGQKLMESKRVVKIYDSKWWRASKFFARFTGITLDEEISLIKKITNPGSADAALDLACGPGIFAHAFAEGSPRRTVFGLDISWPMLSHAARKAKRLGLENITFVHSDAHELPLKDSSVDVANCGAALHMFSDVQHVLGELARVIKPSGRFSAAMFMVRSSSAFSRLKAYLDGGFWGIHYFSEGEIKELLDEAGFEPTVHHAKGLWMIAGALRRH